MMTVIMAISLDQAPIFPEPEPEPEPETEQPHAPPPYTPLKNTAYTCYRATREATEGQRIDLNSTAASGTRAYIVIRGTNRAAGEAGVTASGNTLADFHCAPSSSCPRGVNQKSRWIIIAAFSVCTVLTMLTFFGAGVMSGYGFGYHKGYNDGYDDY